MLSLNSTHKELQTVVLVTAYLTAIFFHETPIEGHRLSEVVWTSLSRHVVKSEKDLSKKAYLKFYLIKICSDWGGLLPEPPAVWTNTRFRWEIDARGNLKDTPSISE